MLRNMENIMVTKKSWWDVGLRRLQKGLVRIAKMILSRSSSFNSSKQNTWSWYNFLTPHSWTLYLTLPQPSMLRANAVLGKSQETSVGNSWDTPGGSLSVWGPVRSHGLCLQHDSMLWPLLCLVIKGDLLVGHWVAENHRRIVWLLGSTRWQLIVWISCFLCDTWQSWVNLNSNPEKQTSARILPRFSHRTAISGPTPLLLLGLPKGEKEEEHAAKHTDLCTSTRAAIRDFFMAFWRFWLAVSF